MSTPESKAIEILSKKYHFSRWTTFVGYIIFVGLLVFPLIAIIFQEKNALSSVLTRWIVGFEGIYTNSNYTQLTILSLPFNDYYQFFMSLIGWALSSCENVISKLYRNIHSYLFTLIFYYISLL